MSLRLAPLRRLTLALLAATIGWTAPALCPAQTPPPPAPAQFDPSDAYFQAYLAARSAEDLEKDRNFTGALEKLEQAAKLLQSISTYYPDWKAEMVAGRVAKTGEILNRVRPLAAEQKRKEQGVIAELEGGIRNPIQPTDPTAPPNPLHADPIATKQLRDYEAEVARLNRVLADSAVPHPDIAQDPNKLRQHQLQRQNLTQQLRAAETNAQNLRSRLARAPVETEVNELNQRLQRVEQERAAMAMALNQSREQHTKSLARAATLEADLKIMTQKAADLQRDLEVQRNTTNTTVAGLRKQLQTLQSTLESKNKELAAAQGQIAELRRELDESRASVDQLREERDALAAERDQMKALLRLNEDGRIQELIEQNMTYAKKVREANEKLDVLSKDNNATKEELIKAQQSVAVAKAEINRLYRDRRSQEQRLMELQRRLDREAGTLAAGGNGADPAEIALLRNIIKRQQRSMERRRQASEILIEAAKQLGNGDPVLTDAIALLEGDELPLTQEEQRLIADRADAELISPFAQDPDRVAYNTQVLGKTIESYDRAATKAFASDRLLPARELFQLILEDNPGHVSSLCKLGVVNLRLNDLAAAADAFRRAVELDASNPYAHRMLGFSLMNLGDLAAAEPPIRRSVELAPNDAKNQNLMGTIAYRLGRTTESETHYKAAIAADPIPSEPYFNLALICARSNRFEDAKTYYQQALERGAAPDPKLEQSIATQTRSEPAPSIPSDRDT